MPAVGRTMQRRILLDHLTIADASPVELAEVANEAGYDGICVFLRKLDVLPIMADFDLVADAALRREFAAFVRDTGLEVAMAYPFTLSRRSRPGDLEPSLDCAAAIGARLVNVLIYERDNLRRTELFGSFCRSCQERGLRVALEPYPLSQVPDLDAGIAMLSGLGDDRVAGLTVDLLHVVRSGGSVADVCAIPPALIALAQASDAPLECAAELREHEASSARLLPGDGELGAAEFLDCLPARCPVSIEAPAHPGDRQPRSRAQRIARARLAKAKLLRTHENGDRHHA